jgi:hypothetical protein
VEWNVGLLLWILGLGLDKFSTFVDSYTTYKLMRRAHSRPAHRLCIARLPGANAWRRVVVIGPGPMGLAAAYRAAKNGYTVPLYEAVTEPGGMAGHIDCDGG